MLSVEGIEFGPVIRLPERYEVYDFTAGYDPDRYRSSPYGIGRYNEKRPTMYAGEQYEEPKRDIHIGLDIAAPVGTAVYAFYEGRIAFQGNNDKAYDYGPTIITEHTWLGQTVYALHGHLSRETLSLHRIGDTFDRGDIIGRLGTKAENGGWNPHLHFQLSLVQPTTYDLPGVVSAADREWALKNYPDPRLVLGPLY